MSRAENLLEVKPDSLSQEAVVKVASRMGRRSFLKTTASASVGLCIAGFVPELLSAAARRAAATSSSFAPNAFVRIALDNTVTVISGHSEMGQGIYTSLAMVLNEELEADWSKVRVESAPVDPAYNHTIYGVQMTGVSSSTPSEWERLRKMGAMARIMLVQAAAQKWNVDPSGCRVANGVVIHAASGKKATYGSLTADAAQLKPPTDVKLKDPKQFTLVGKPKHRVDTKEKTNGTAQFGLDVNLPNMVHAVVARPPVFGGKVKSVDATEAKKIPGVLAIEQIPEGVAVVAKSFWSAKQAREKLNVSWDDGPNASLSTEQMLADFSKQSANPGIVAKKEGDAPSALKGAAKTVGLPPEKVKINTTLLGGGFGRRANPASDFIIEAVNVAKVAKAPVKVVWTREDDLAGGWYRPMWHDRFSAGLDAQGNPVAWTHTIVGQSILDGTLFESFGIKNGVDSASVEGAADILYGIPNLQVDLHSPKIGVPVQWWRSVGHSHTGFSVEGFFDEVAHAGGKDPFELRPKLLANQPRMLAVLELAVAKGRGRGIATHFSFDSYVAQVVEASVEKDGTARVHRVVCAVDCGRAINPDVVKAQMEGGIIFGLTAALKTEITLEQGRVQQTNFH